MKSESGLALQWLASPCGCQFQQKCFHVMLIFQDDLVQGWPRKQYRTTTSYLGLSLARKQKLLQNLLLNWKKRRCSVYQFSQEAESRTKSSVFGHKKEEEDKIIRWWLVTGNFHGDLSCKHLQILSQNLLSKMEEEEKDDGQWWSTSPTD